MIKKYYFRDRNRQVNFTVVAADKHTYATVEDQPPPSPPPSIHTHNIDTNTNIVYNNNNNNNNKVNCDDSMEDPRYASLAVNHATPKEGNSPKSPRPKCSPRDDLSGDYAEIGQ